MALTLIITAAEKAISLTLGAVNNQQGVIINAADDIMVYKEMFTPANSHFLVQSPL